MKPERGKKSSLRASLRKTFKRGAKNKTASVSHQLVEVRELLKAGATKKTPTKNKGLIPSDLLHTPLGTPCSKKQKLDDFRTPVTPLVLTKPTTRSRRKTEVIVIDTAIPDDNLANTSGASSSSSLTIGSVDNDESRLSSFTSSDLDESGERSPSPVQTSLSEEEGEDGVDGPGSPLDQSSENVPCTFLDKYRLVPLESKSSYLLLLPLGNTRLPIRGLARIKSLYNTVSILGYRITPELKDPVAVFCPTNVSFLLLETSERISDELTRDEKKLLLERLSSYQLCSSTRKELVNEMRTDSVLLHVSKLKHEPSNYLTNCGSYKHLYTGGSAKKTLAKDEISICHKVGLFMNPTGAQGQNIILPLDDYKIAAETIMAAVQHDKAPKVLLVGPKNSGKSTALRFMVNRLQNISADACYLECDPGQTEFTVPAVLSLHVIKTPLLGPPFTHLREPELAFFLGDVNPADHAGNYIKIITALYQRYLEKFASMPLFINTMGWVEGLGLRLLREITGLIHPTHVVQLVSPEEEPVSLVPRVADKRELGYFNISSETDMPVLQPEQVLRIDSRCHSDSYQASSHRQLNILASLSRLHVLHPNVDQLLAAPPYAVPWSHVYLHVCHQHVPISQLLYAANANIVALCSTSREEMERCGVEESKEGLKTFSKTPMSEFIGLGIVRGIDPRKKVFYVLPAVPTQMLSRVNALLISSLSIPECIFKQQSSDHEVPYLSESYASQICGSNPVRPKTYLKRGQGGRTKT